MDSSQPDRRASGFPFRLGAGILIFNLCLILLAGFSLAQSRHQYEDRAEITAQNLATVLQQGTSEIIHRIDLILQALPAKTPQASAEAAAGLGRLVAIADLDNLVRTDAQGLVVNAAGTGFQPGQSVAGSPFFQRLKASPQAGMILDGPRKGRPDGPWEELFARRIESPDGSFHGVAFTTVPLAKLRAIFAPVDVGPKGIMLLRGQDLNLILASYPGQRNPGPQDSLDRREPSAELRRRVAQGRLMDTFPAVNPSDRTRRTICFRRVSDYPLLVVVGLAGQDYFAGWWREAQETALLAGGMVLLTCLTGWLGIRAWRRRNAVTEALQESETRFRQVAESLDEWVWEIDADGVYRYASPAVERVLGYRPGELVGRKTFYDLFTEDAREVLKEQAFRFFAAQERITRLPNANRHKDGHVVYLETTGSPMVDAQGRLLGYRGADTDVTARTHAEQALRDAEAHQRALLRALPDLLFLVDREGRFLSYHAPASRHLALPAEAFLGRTLGEVMPPEVAAAALACLAKTLATGEVQSLDYVLEQENGPRHFEGKFAKAAEGTVLILARDLTERRLEQEAQRRLEVELHHAQKLESLGSLAGGVAHDMNNVLAAIMGLASTQQGLNPDNAPLLKALGTIERAADRGSVLVRGLTEFARKDLEAPKLMDLNELVRKEMAILGRTSFNKVELSATLVEALPLIMGEPSALASALMNLCVNAVDAMPDGGTLQLLTRRGEGSQVELLVTDSGQGMTAEVLARATEPFYTTKPLGKGTGLGLSLVYGTVKAHGGSMAIQSEVGRGTQVCLRFPGLERATLPEAVAALPVAGRRGLRVLLVDDDELILEAVPPMLKHLGHEVTAVADGLEALQQCQAGQGFHVVILDNNMPGLSGMETLAQLRKFRPDLPVIIATGRADAAVVAAVAQDGNLYLLPKPFGLQGLREALGGLAQAAVEAG